MGCFLACFGFKENKKRRRPGKRSPSGEQDHRSYVPLDSDISINVKENITSDSNQLKEKPKEAAVQKIKKKVSFNLNVKAYEPIPNYNDDDDDDMCAYLSEGEEETKWEFNKENLHYEEEDAIAPKWSFPSNHRYQNCRDSSDEEDNEFKLDLGFDEIEGSDDDDDVIDDEVAVIGGQTGEAENGRVQDIVESKSNVRDRSKYVSSVLNPVENICQWKVVKAKAAVPQVKCGLKENSVAVDASLSNWLEI